MSCSGLGCSCCLVACGNDQCKFLLPSRSSLLFTERSIIKDHFTFTSVKEIYSVVHCRLGMLITLSLIGGLAGVTGAASLTKFFCEAFGKGISCKAPGSSSKKGDSQLERCDSAGIPVALAADAQLIRGLLDDAEITLRGLRRDRPGPSRR